MRECERLVAQRAHAQMLADHGQTTMPQRGIFAVTVPGTVAGWGALREKFGTLPMSTLLAPAIRAAEEGFPVMEITAGHWRGSEEFLRSEPEAARTFLIDGHAPHAGEIFRNPALAASLKRIAEHGPAGYYEGATAEAIVTASRERGGTFTRRTSRNSAPSGPNRSRPRIAAGASMKSARTRRASPR